MTFTTLFGLMAVIPAVLLQLNTVCSEIDDAFETCTALGGTLQVLVRQLYYFPTKNLTGSRMVENVFGGNRKEHLPNVQLLAAEYVEQENAACKA